MRTPVVSLLVWSFVVACAPREPPRAPTVVASATPLPSVASTTPSASASASGPATHPPAPPTYEAEARQILDEMIAVDTSHGNESKLLAPIADRYRRAGVPVQILESSPGRGNLIARIKGSGAKKPMLLLAHVDVVPIEGQPWTVPAFATTEKDGFLYGRGVNDDKSMAAAIVALTLEMARAKTTPARDVIIALTAGEETGGFAGARWLVENHKELIDAELALNEGGGALTDDAQARVLSVNVGVSEKVFQTYKIIARGKGGHSAVPPTIGDPVVALAKALLKIGAMRMAARILPEVKASFVMNLPWAEVKYVEAVRHAIASAPRVEKADDDVLATDAALNAQIRTTCTTTMLQAAPQDNVLPTTAEATVNCRLLPGDTREQVKDALAKAIDDPKLEIVPAPSIGDAAASPIECEVMDAVRRVVASAYPGAVVIPGMGNGATDSRFMRGAGIRAYGVSPLVGSRPEGRSGHVAHGADERRALKWINPALRYFREVVRTLAL